MKAGVSAPLRCARNDEREEEGSFDWFRSLCDLNSAQHDSELMIADLSTGNRRLMIDN